MGHGIGDGALIAESIPQDEAEAVIDFIARLTAWESMVGGGSEQTHYGFVNLGQPQKETVADLLARLNEARSHLQHLAYPDARELEPDPDSELDWRRERRHKRWSWLGKLSPFK